jgi:malonyl CoA-acyl carrier protein transacylase
MIGTTPTILAAPPSGTPAGLPSSDATSGAPAWETELFVLQGQSRHDLKERALALAGYLDSHPQLSLKDLAFTLNTGLPPGGKRLAIVAGTVGDLQARLRRASERLADTRILQIRDVTGIYYFEQPLHPQGRVAVLFPGEGAQYLNMLRDLYAHFTEVQACFEDYHCRAVQSGRPDQTLSRLLFVADDAGAQERARAEGELRQLGNAMFSVLVADWAIYQVLSKLGLAADTLAGHSMGELAALWAGGALVTDNLVLEQVIATLEGLQRRENGGDSPEAVLLAVGAGRQLMTELIAQRAPGSVYLAMDNCPHQSVVVGPPAPMAAVEAEIRARRIVCERLPFGRPYHTSLFEPAMGKLDQMFDSATFQSPRVPVYSCTTSLPFPSDPVAIRRLAVAHWASPVQFTQMIENMYADGVRLFVEAGPRGNLSSFVEDILRGRSFVALPADTPRRSGTTQLNHVAGQLAAHHVPLRLEYLYSRRSPVPLAWESCQSSDACQGVSPPPPRSPRAVVLSRYLDVMEQFLDVQHQVLAKYLAGRWQLGRDRATAVPHTVAPVYVAPQQTRPMLGEIIRHVPGRELTMRRRLNLAEDLFAGDHTVGGRTVSKTDPSQHGLPVMPMTFSLEMLAETASALVPGKTVIGLKRIRLLRWLPFDDEELTTVEVSARVLPEEIPDLETGARTEVALEIRDLGNGLQPANSKSVAVKGIVVLADRFPQPPALGKFNLTNDHSSRVSLEVLYRNLFHGPLFQGVISTDRVGDEGIESRVRVLPRTGLFRSDPDPDMILDPVLLDVAMHPLAAWHLEQPDQSGRILLPFELEGVELYGPRPPVGARLQSRGRIENASRRHFTHAVDIVGTGGELWCRLVSAKYWRFYVPFGEVNFHGPKDEYFLSSPSKEPGDTRASARPLLPSAQPPFSIMWLEPPRDLQQRALRLATARITLSPSELRRFRQLREPDAKLTEWLFSRIVAKDAVRTLWYERHGERIFPADIELEVGPHGRFRARRRASPADDDMPAVCVAHSDGLFAAASAFVSHMGIAFQPYPSPPNQEEPVFAEAERAILRRLDMAQSEVRARFQCALRAAANALGLDHRDSQRLAIRAFDQDSGKTTIAIDAGAGPRHGEQQAAPLIVWTVVEGNRAVALTLGEQEPS